MRPEDLELAYKGARVRIAELEDLVRVLDMQVDAGRNIIARAHMGSRPIDGVKTSGAKGGPEYVACCHHQGHAEIHAMNLINAEAETIKKEREA